MVNSKSNKMRLEINNDVELDINNASNKKSKKSRKNLTQKRMLSAKSAKLAKKKRPSKKILIKGKRVPAKVMKMASGPKMKRVAFTASRKSSDSRRRASDARRKVSASRRKASDARRKASASRRKASDARRRASDTKRSLRPSELAKLPKIYFNFRTWSWRRDSEGDG